MSKIDANPWPVFLSMVALVGLFIGLQYEIFFLGYYRAHGDFTLIHFSNTLFLNGLFNGMEIPLWNPYKFLGSLEYFGIVFFNPFATLLSGLYLLVGDFLGTPSHMMFQVTYLAYLSCYVLFFAIGCYFLAAEFVMDRWIRVCCFAMALFGTHVYWMVYVLQYSLFFLPFFLIFAVRTIKYQRQGLVANVTGGVLSFQLWLITNSVYLNQQINLVIMLVLAWLLTADNPITQVANSFGGVVNLLKGRYSIFGQAGFRILWVLALCISLMALKLALVSRLGDFETFRSPFVNPVTYMNYTAMEKYTNDLTTLLKNMFNIYIPEIQNKTGHFPALYYGILSFLFLILTWKHMKGRAFAILFSAGTGLIVISTNLNDGFNVILPLMSVLNPIFGFGTRHIDAGVVFAVPLVITTLGMALDRFVTLRQQPRYFHRARLLILLLMTSTFILAVVSNISLRIEPIRAQLTNPEFPTHLFMVTVLFFLIIYLPDRFFKKIGISHGFVILLVILVELAIPFRGFVDSFFSSFINDSSNRHPFGVGLPGPHLRGFPAPFAHQFPYRFDDRGLSTTTNEYDEFHNAAFKFVSTKKSPMLEMRFPAVAGEQDLLAHSERLFLVDNILFGNGLDQSRLWTHEIYKRNAHRRIAVVDLGKNGSPIIKPDRAVRVAHTLPDAFGYLTEQQETLASAPAPILRKIPASTFTFAGTDNVNPEIRLFDASLPPDFPRFVSTNLFNRDVDNLDLMDANGVSFSPVFFDLFERENRYQIGYRNPGIRISVKVGQEISDMTLSWKDPWQADGITIRHFSFNSLELALNLDRDRFLVYMDHFHAPYWKADLDGVAVEIYRTNGDFKGILIPSGNHILRFTYTDDVLKSSIIVYGILFFPALLIVITLVWKGPRTTSRNLSHG